MQAERPFLFIYAGVTARVHAWPRRESDETSEEMPQFCAAESQSAPPPEEEEEGAVAVGLKQSGGDGGGILGKLICARAAKDMVMSEAAVEEGSRSSSGTTMD